MGDSNFPFKYCRDFPGGPVVKNPPSTTGNTGSIPGWGIKIPLLEETDRTGSILKAGLDLGLDCKL